MSTPFGILIVIFGPLVFHPERIAIVAAILTGLFFVTAFLKRFRRIPVLIAALAWWAYVPIEYQAMVNQWNIRVDLLVMFPLLLVVSIWAVISLFLPPVSQS